MPGIVLVIDICLRVLILVSEAEVWVNHTAHALHPWFLQSPTSLIHSLPISLPLPLTGTHYDVMMYGAISMCPTDMWFRRHVALNPHKVP